MILIPQTPCVLDKTLERAGFPGFVQELRDRLMLIPEPIDGTEFLDILLLLEESVSDFHDLDFSRKFFDSLIKERKFILFRNLSQRAKNILQRNFSPLASQLSTIIKDLPPDFFQN